MITTKKLAEQYLVKTMLGMPPTVSASTIERDGRKQKKAVRELEDAELITLKTLDDGVDLDDDLYLITAKVLDEFPAEPCGDDELFEIWKSRRGPSSSKYRDEPYVVIGTYQLENESISLGQLRTLIESEDTNWYACIGWQGAPYRMETLQGPVSLCDVPKARKGANDGRSYETLTMVSSTGLEELIDEHLMQENIAYNFPRQLKWGLQAFEILTKEEAEKLSMGLSGMILRGSSLSFSEEDPNNWGENLAKATDSLVDQLGTIQERLAIALKIERGITKLGGWDTFLELYGEKLEEALRKQAEQSEEEVAEEATA